MDQRLIINCDGLCEPRNPGGTATFGWVARRAGTLVASDNAVICRGPQATNNLAEYSAVIAAANWALHWAADGEPILFRTDSQLVVNQVNGQWQVRSPKIAPLCAEARQLLGRLRRSHNVRLEWVPRAQNAEADALSRVAYSTSGGGDLRAQKAQTLAGGVRRLAGDRFFAVAASSGDGEYRVDLAAGACTCKDFERRHAACKHILAARTFAGAGES